MSEGKLIGIATLLALLAGAFSLIVCAGAAPALAEGTHESSPLVHPHAFGAE